LSFGNNWASIFYAKHFDKVLALREIFNFVKAMIKDPKRSSYLGFDDVHGSFHILDNADELELL